MSKKVNITDCSIVGIYKNGFLTGEKHTTENGTRYEIITYSSIRDKVIQVWLSDWCFNLIDS